MSVSKRSSVASSSSAGLLWVALAALGIAVLLAAAAYTAYWFLAFETLRSQFQAWVEQQRAEGNRVTYYSEERSGFPFVIRLTLREMLVTTPEGVSWLSTLTGLEARPLIGDSLRLTFGGEQELRLPLRRGTEMLSLSARAEQLSLDLGDAASADAAELTASNLTLSLKRRAGALLIPSLSVTMRSEPALDNTAPPGTAPPGPPGASSGGGRRLALAASGIALPEGIAWPLGRTVAEIALAARLAGDLPRGIPLSQAPSAWREAGGHIAIERLALVYGPLSLAGDGMVAIDPQGQPSGALALRIAGLHPTVDALVDRGILSPAVAETVLALAQTLAPAGTGGTVTLPLTLQDQTLSLGGMTVARLPPLPSQPR
jgi:hypothetical protein